MSFLHVVLFLFFPVESFKFNSVRFGCFTEKKLTIWELLNVHIATNKKLL